MATAVKPPGVATGNYQAHSSASCASDAERTRVPRGARATSRAGDAQALADSAAGAERTRVPRGEKTGMRILTVVFLDSGANSSIHSALDSENSRIHVQGISSLVAATLACVPSFPRLFASVAASPAAVSAARAAEVPMHGGIAEVHSGKGHRGRVDTKGLDSSASEDKVSDLKETAPYLRTAGVQGGAWSRCLKQEKKGRAVTASLHLGVPHSLSVTPGHGKGIRQQLGWRKVCAGPARSGVWVLQGDTRGFTLPSIQDDSSVDWIKRSKKCTAWARLSVCVQHGNGVAGWTTIQGLGLDWSQGIVGQGRSLPLTPSCSNGGCHLE